MIRIDEITVPARKRALNEQKVQELAASMAEVGLLNPITISTGSRLIAGHHRLEAAKRLGWDEIPAHTLPGDAILHEKAEIHENLRRNELTVLERGEQEARLKEIYLLEHPETRPVSERGGPGRGHKTDEIISPVSFAEETAATIGVSPRTVQQEVQIAERLTEETKAIVAAHPAAALLPCRASNRWTPGAHRPFFPMCPGSVVSGYSHGNILKLSYWSRQDDVLTH